MSNEFTSVISKVSNGGVMTNLNVFAQLKVLAFVIFFVFSPLVKGTAQQPDTIVIQNIELPLTTNPLDVLIEEKAWTPPENAAIWSSNWRGYIAQWTIEAGFLKLVDATYLLADEPIDKPKRQSIVSQLLPEQHDRVARWYSGALIVPDGEMINYVHMGYGSSYSHYQVLRVLNGVVIEHLSFTDEQFEKYRATKFQEFMETPEFASQLDELVNGEDAWSEEEALYFMQSFYAEYYLSL